MGQVVGADAEICVACACDAYFCAHSSRREVTAADTNAGNIRRPMRRLCFAVALLAGACTKDLGDPQARYLEPALAATPLTLMPDARLVPAHGGGALVAIGATEVRWAVLAPDGRLGGEAAAPLPPRTAGPWVGLASAATPGDRVVVVWGEPQADPAAGLRLRASIMGAGGADATTFDLDAVPAASVANLRLLVGTDATATSTAVVTGIEGQPSTPVTVRVLRAGIAEPPAPTTVSGVPPTWRCLSLSTSRSAFAVVAASAAPEDTSSDKTPFSVVELNGDGNPVFIHRLSITVREPRCPMTTVTPAGYLMALQTDAGTFLADYDIAASSSPTNFVLGSVRFGGPDKQPSVVGVAQLSRSNLALLARPGGPEVWTFDRQGRIRGEPLRLPVAAPLPTGSVITAQVVAADLWVSYLDGGVRRFLRVQPTAPPVDSPVDAGPRD